MTVAVTAAVPLPGCCQLTALQLPDVPCTCVDVCHLPWCSSVSGREEQQRLAVTQPLSLGQGWEVVGRQTVPRMIHAANSRVELGESAAASHLHVI